MVAMRSLERLRNSMIIKKLRGLVDIIWWFKNVGFRRKAISCWMETWESRLNFLSIITLFASLVSLIIGLSFIAISRHLTDFLSNFIISSIKIASHNFLLLALFFFFVAIFLAAIYNRVIARQYKLGEELYQKKGAYHADGDHHGIVLIKYSTKSKKTDYAVIPLFVNGFYGKIPYKIYLIENKSDFLKAYYDNKVRYLWILGHGDRGGFCYGRCKDQYVKYSDRLPQKAKKFIAQLHCNHGEGQTLAELNGIEVDYDTDHVRMSIQNYFYIERKVLEFLENLD